MNSKKENALCRRLRQIPGFGPLVSTATVAAGDRDRRGKEMTLLDALRKFTGIRISGWFVSPRDLSCKSRGRKPEPREAQL